nr:hypothetical protein CFP56_14749 [Quercus suber]
MEGWIVLVMNKNAGHGKEMKEKADEIGKQIRAIVDFTFDIEIHIREYFVEDPTLRYVGGSVHTLTEIDPDKLSFFEIRDLCHLVGASKEHSRYRYLHLEGDLEHDLSVIDIDPVEHPDGGGVANDGVGGDGGVDSLGHEQERGPRQGDEEEGNEIGK